MVCAVKFPISEFYGPVNDVKVQNMPNKLAKITLLTAKCYS